MFEQKKHLLCLALLALDTLLLSAIVWALVGFATLPSHLSGAVPGWGPYPGLAERLVFGVLVGAWALRLYFGAYHTTLLGLVRTPSHVVTGALAVLQGSGVFMVAGWLLRVPLHDLVIRTAGCTLCALAYVVLLSPAVSRVLLSFLKRRGLATRVLLCARPSQAEELLKRFIHPHYAILSPVGLLHTAGQNEGAAPGCPGLTSLQGAPRAADFLIEAHVQTVVVADMSDDWPRELLMQRCLEAGITCWQVDPGGVPPPGDESCPPACQDLLASGRTPGRILAKELLDALAALLLTVCLAPLMGLIGLLVRLTSGGPVLFRQERNGLYGKPFVMYKFRSMRVGSEALHASLAAAEPVDILFKPENDPRVTRFGRFLRRSSLDELPQFWNVLKGDMSLVGPRPMTPYETETLPRLGDRRRLCMKPGITGLWQISGRSTIRTMRERVDLDLAYVDDWSLRQDLRILLKTIPTVLSARGAQ